MRLFIICISMILALAANAQSNGNGAWTTSWGTSPEYTGESDMPRSPLKGKTIRQVIRPSIGGDTIRLALSNFHSDEPVEIKGAYISLSVDTLVRDKQTGKIISHNGSTPWIGKGTTRFLTFNGSRAVTIAPRSNITSDPIAFTVVPCRNIAITINYGEKVPLHATSHRGSRTTSYIADGTVGPADSLNVIERLEHWYNILSLDVKRGAPVIAVLGNSITDGRGTTTNAQNRWTDYMGAELNCHGMKQVSKKGNRDTAASGCGIINLGIGGNCVLEGGISEPLIKRYRDELDFHAGITHIIIYEGTNDIGTSQLKPESLALRLTEAYKEIITYAHSRGVKVFMATITPTKGNNWYSPSHEKARQMVNEWIRKGEGFEGIIDFDKLVRDPKDSEKLRAEYSEDWLHLNPAGYEAMGKYAARIIGNDLKQNKIQH